MTLTTARQDVTRAVARLRSLGVKVSTIIGHDAVAGEYHYGLRVPEGLDPREIAVETWTHHGRVGVPRYSDGHHAFVYVERPRVNDIQARTARAVEARQMLDKVADWIEQKS